MQPDRKSAWELSAFPVPKRGVGGSEHEWCRVSVHGASNSPFCPRKKQILLLGLEAFARQKAGVIGTPPREGPESWHFK